MLADPLTKNLNGNKLANLTNNKKNGRVNFINIKLYSSLSLIKY